MNKTLFSEQNMLDTITEVDSSLSLGDVLDESSKDSPDDDFPKSQCHNAVFDLDSMENRSKGVLAKKLESGHNQYPYQKIIFDIISAEMPMAAEGLCDEQFSLDSRDIETVDPSYSEFSGTAELPTIKQTSASTTAARPHENTSVASCYTENSDAIITLETSKHTAEASATGEEDYLFRALLQERRRPSDGSVSALSCPFNASFQDRTLDDDISSIGWQSGNHTSTSSASKANKGHNKGDYFSGIEDVIDGIVNVPSCSIHKENSREDDDFYKELKAIQKTAAALKQSLPRQQFSQHSNCKTPLLDSSCNSAYSDCIEELQIEKNSAVASITGAADFPLQGRSWHTETSDRFPPRRKSRRKSHESMEDLCDLSQGDMESTSHSEVPSVADTSRLQSKTFEIKRTAPSLLLNGSEVSLDEFKEAFLKELPDTVSNAVPCRVWEGALDNAILSFVNSENGSSGSPKPSKKPCLGAAAKALSPVTKGLRKLRKNIIFEKSHKHPESEVKCPNTLDN
mmetsp:Transcript_29171/g.54795  ORF Transcript_29171/g.54795 Transcript_29171/m.54795 type:complete len:513 (-) Transcript_29171:971-2509(-)